MWNTPLQPIMIGITVAVAMSLSACDSSNKNTVEEVASDISAEAPKDEAPIQESTSPDADLDGATANQGSPVKYDISTWNGSTVEPVNINELDDIQSTFGKVITTDENSLDYASNPATKYRFMSTDAPYLDVIDSQKYLELGWYYANPTDSDEEKEQSKTHAKKAYKVARQLMGDDGGKVLADMLSGQVVKKQTIGGQKIELAKCEFYSCMLVFNKTDAQTSDS